MPLRLTERLRRRFARLVPRTRRSRLLVAAPVVLMLAWFLVPQLFVPMIRGKLQGMISGKLDARLHIGRLMYAPPFGVRARDVRLLSGAGADYPNTELLKVAKLDLKLARSPFRDGPLVIQNITVHDPEVRLIRTAGGRLVGMHALVRKDAADPSTQPTTRPGANSLARWSPKSSPTASAAGCAKASIHGPRPRRWASPQR